MHKGIMHEEYEGTEGKETYCQKTDRGSQLPPYIDPADHIHHKKIRSSVPMAVRK